MEIRHDWSRDEIRTIYHLALPELNVALQELTYNRLGVGQ
jgi:hypothetical protein